MGGRGSGSPGGAAAAHALASYQGGRYVDINEFARSGGELRAGSVFATRAEALRNQAALDAAIRAGTAPSKLYRGIGEGREGITGELRKGSTIRDLGYSSTSTNRGVATEFARGKRGATVLEIEVPRGTRGARIKADGGLRESEVLLARGTRYEVTSVTVRNGIRYARVRIKR